MTRVLVTGFEPFAGSSANPSQRLVEELAAWPPAGISVERFALNLDDA